MSTAPTDRAVLIPVRRRVEHIDTDASGVVHFARYPSLLETALLENLERLGVGIAALAEHGTELVVVDLRMRYRAPARYPDEVSLEVSVGHVGAARMQIDGVVRRAADHAELATGTLVLALVTSSAGSVCALPSTLRELLLEAKSHAVD